MTRNQKSDKAKRITYWVVTGFLVFAMMAGGFAQFIQAKFNTDGFIRLGYPLYSMKIIGIWKIAGGIVLLVPGYPLMKEWAYAGFFVLLTSAVISHIAAGDVFYQWAGALTFALLTVWSWSIRPADRRLNTETAPVNKQPVY